jgi:hypothetical protein
MEGNNERLKENMEEVKRSGAKYNNVEGKWTDRGRCLRENVVDKVEGVTLGGGRRRNPGRVVC